MAVYGRAQLHDLGRAVELFCIHAAELGIRAPAVVIINTPFTAPAAQAFTDALHRHGIHEKSIDFVDATKPDYTDLAVKIRLEGADSIMAGLDPFSYARFFQALDRQNFHAPFMGVGLDKKSAEKQYGTAVYGAESGTAFLEPDGHMDVPAIREYHAAMERYFPNEVDDLDVYAEETWVSAKLFVEALRRLGPAPVTAKTLVDSANRIHNFETGLTVPLSFGPGAHDPNHCMQWASGTPTRAGTASEGASRPSELAGENQVDELGVPAAEVRPPAGGDPQGGERPGGELRPQPLGLGPGRGQGEREVLHRGVVTHEHHRGGGGGDAAEALEQLLRRGAVQPVLDEDPRPRGERRPDQVEGLASAAGGGAEHELRRDPALAEKLRHRGRRAPAARGERAVVVGELLVRPARLGVTEQVEGGHPGSRRYHARLG